MKKSLSKKLLLIGILLTATLASCDNFFDHHEDKKFETARFSSEVVTEWMNLLLKLTKETPGFSPPVAARAFGYTGLGLYESVRFGMPGYKSMAGQVNGFDQSYLADLEPNGDYHWGVVANTALAEIIRECFLPAAEENMEAIAALEKQFNQKYQSEVSSEIFNRSKVLGHSVAAKMIEYTNADGQKECYKNNFPGSYLPPSGDGLWVPTPPGFQSAMQPYWGDVRPFMAANVSDIQTPAPPVYSTDPESPFYKETMEVYNSVNNLTEEQLTIAEYWSDDPGLTTTPPGHSLSILKQVLEMEGANLATAAVAFAKLGMGVHDAFISCWKVKYIYNLIRPITVIQLYIDPNFGIPLNTPPFPEYTSGHSVQSGAAAQILSDLFGSNYSFTDHTHESRSDINGTPRSFDSFFEFANEAAISRLYGGIHYRSAIEQGVIQGKKIGKNIGSLKFR